jgi:hypothetical protein
VYNGELHGTIVGKPIVHDGRAVNASVCKLTKILSTHSSNLFHMHLFTSCTWCSNLS